MKKIIKYKFVLLIICDILLIPGLFFCEWLSDRMLAQSGVCVWTLVGIQCITCGGTRLVNALLNGHILQAFQYNPFIFVIAMLLAFSYVMLHLWWFGNIQFAKKFLKMVYSVPGVCIFGASCIYFLILRNIPSWIQLIKFLADQIFK